MVYLDKELMRQLQRVVLWLEPTKEKDPGTSSDSYVTQDINIYRKYSHLVLVLVWELDPYWVLLPVLKLGRLVLVP